MRAITFRGWKSFVCKKKTSLKWSLWPHLTILLSQSYFCCPKKTCHRPPNSQKLLSEELCDLWYVMPHHWSLCFLLSPCYLQDVMPCQWSSSDLPQVLQLWDRVFYSQAFFTLHSSLLVLRLPWEPAVQPQG